MLASTRRSFNVDASGCTSRRVCAYFAQWVIKSRPLKQAAVS
jgi:predicted phage tail protein